MRKEEVLMVSFGGPTDECCGHFDECPGKAHCFVSGIFGHDKAREKRIKEVAHHYEELGGFSNFNALTEKQAAALEEELAKRGKPLRVRSGYRHWMPWVADVVQEQKNEGVERLHVLVMAPHQSSVSWDWYLRVVAEGIEAAGDGAPQIASIVKPWWKEAGFIDALADRIREAAGDAKVSLDDPKVGLLLTAHAIPASVARTSPYCQQVEETAKLVSEALGVKDSLLAYQSQPGDSTIPWTSPALDDGVKSLLDAGKTTVIGSAIGFLCDNVEVLYDLGVEAKRDVEAAGATFVRAESVHDHHAFVSLLADRVSEAVESAQAAV
ncbi:MAG: ferrochelatase [Planctomycetes bacterium]|nr:ferrochelatase [Planctomycetota bacterium]